MPNYALSINSTFQPLSFERYIQPYQIYGEEYKRQEQALNELEMKASIWEGLANKQTDKAAYEQYKQYADALREQANLIAQEGLSIGSRNALNELKRRYVTDILPIEQAYQRRAEQQKAQREILLKDPTRLFNNMASQQSLDYYMNNPTYDATEQQVSGALISSMVSDAGKRIAQELHSYKLEDLPGDSYTNILRQKYGISPDEITNYLKDPTNPNNKPVLKALVDMAIGTTDVPNWNNQDVLDRLTQYGNMGLWSTVGNETITPMEDFGKREGLKLQHDLTKMATEFQYNTKLQAQRHRDAMEELAAKGVDGGGGGAALHTWDATVDSPFNSQNLQDVLKLATGKGDEKFSMDYFGKFNYNGVRSIANPMRVYEEYEKYAIENTKTVYDHSGSFAPSVSTLDTSTGRQQKKEPDYAGALRHVQQLYGVKKVITPSQYNTLKNLGYNSVSTRAEFHDIGNKVNQTASVYFPREVNMGNYDQANKWIVQSATDNKVYKNAKGKTFSYYDLFKEDGKDSKTTGEINGVAYNPSHPKELAISVANKKGTNVYYVNPSVFGMQTQNLVNSFGSQISSAIKDRRIDQADQLTQLLMQELIMIFNSYTPARSRTSSKE